MLLSIVENLSVDAETTQARIQALRNQVETVKEEVRENERKVRASMHLLDELKFLY